MESRIRLFAIGIIAAYALIALGVVALVWWQTGRFGHPLVLIMAGLLLITAVVMTLLLQMMPDSRGLVFFGVFFGLIVLPHFIAIAVAPREALRSVAQSSAAPAAAAAPQPATEVPLITDLGAGVLDARTATLAAYPDGSQVVDIRYDTPEFARLRFLREYDNQPPPLARLGAHDGVLVESEGYTRFQYQHGDRVVRITGADRGALEHRLQQLAQAAAPAPLAPVAAPEPRQDGLLDRFSLAQMAGATLLYTLFVAWVFFRLSTWAASTPAPAGSQALPETALRARLLQIGQTDLPFSVEPGERADELIAEWRYADATWVDLMRARRLSRVIRYRLRLDEASHSVRVREFQAAFDASASTGSADLHYRAQWGITFFESRVEGVLGLQIRDGRPTRDLAYVYRFDVDEIRGPLVQIVNQAGWSWRAVMLDAKWLTG